MGLNAFWSGSGKKQGDIKGSCDIDPHTDKCEIWGWSHEVVSPRDAASGAPTGKRQHKPFVITKAVDKASPLFMNALVNNEEISTWKLEIYRPSADGAEQHYFTIELKAANLSGIRQEQLNNKYAENMPHPFREHLSFTYQHIIWTWEDGGISAEDNWKTQV